MIIMMIDHATRSLVAVFFQSRGKFRRYFGITQGQLARLRKLYRRMPEKFFLWECFGTAGYVWSLRRSYKEAKIGGLV